VLRFSGEPEVDIGRLDAAPGHSGAATVRILAEKKIKDAVLDAIGTAESGDSLRLAMFYLSDRDVIAALGAAFGRGVAVQVLLDPNKDAFGRRKNGVPARPVARELDAAGLPVRWCDTHGEQCHMKMLLVDRADGSSVLIAGSANFTRRNLEDFNLETNVEVRGPASSAALAASRRFFDTLWRNEPDRHFSVAYADYADESLYKRLLYRFMEGSGISTF
jgi:phosphatidylserine/phosphatidylglycerophosphate/cardiolipin synthase-like enzyme